MEQASNAKRIVPWIFYIIFFGVLNETVFNVSTPNIAAQFNLLPAGVSWVITIFIIFFGMGSVIYGKLSDIYSIKKLIVVGILIYNIGSILGFVFQSSYPLVIVCRAIQGAGASAIPALVMVVVARYFSPEERGKLFGILTSTVSFSIGIGPVLGGFIAETFHWSYLFLIPLFTLVAIPSFRKWLPEQEAGQGKLDVLGTFLLGIGISSLVLYLTEADLPYLLISVVLIVWFVIHIRRSPHPFVDPDLFANRLYSNGLVIGFIIFSTVFGILFIIPLMLNKVYHLDPDAIGLVMFPGAISGVIFGTVGGNLTAKKGSHFVVYIGLALIISSMLCFSTLIGFPIWLIGACLLLMYIGFSFMQTALAESITSIMPVERMGVGMGFYNLTAFISGAVGTALIARLMNLSALNVRINPFVADPLGHVYSNLFILFGFILLVGGCLYFWSFGRAGRYQRGDQPVG
ncbi:MFS transporter [Effusibacillus consociatus]|uniref:MFS transporter n=1 Tax=Effusibacillus consociatus TaxID=1117041 RepID=A0ABV9Q941_9BACL